MSREENAVKRIAILGSTGSIGTQALDIISRHPDRYRVSALSCARRIDGLRQQIREFSPEMITVDREEDAKALKAEFPRLEVRWGREGLKAAASMEGADMVLNSLMGMRGLEPTLAAIDAGRDIAFANKETLVAGGELVMRKAREKGIHLLPVDSEHSAIFQSLQGNEGNGIRRILLTASGGPFRGFSLEQLKEVSVEQALNHPNWSMGSKITIDSASLLNKGLEIIEARWLFDVPLEKIQVLVHPQSVLHSAVEYMDGSVIGQMGLPDMRVPIAYAFAWPERLPMGGSMKALDLLAYPEGLTFEEVDSRVFRTIELAREASRRGRTYPVCLNGAGEVLTEAFLKGRIRFLQIQELLEEVLSRHVPEGDTGLEAILEADRKTRTETENIISGIEGKG